MFIREGRRRQPHSPRRIAPTCAHSPPRESRRWRGGDEAGEGISANYLNQSKIAHVRCIQRHGETTPAKLPFSIPWQPRRWLDSTLMNQGVAVAMLAEKEGTGGGREIALAG